MFYVRVSAFADALVLMLSEGLTYTTYRFMFNLNSTIMKKLESIFLWGAFICALLLSVMCGVRFIQTADNSCLAFAIVFALGVVVLGRIIHYKW